MRAHCAVLQCHRCACTAAWQNRKRSPKGTVRACHMRCHTIADSLERLGVRAYLVVLVPHHLEELQRCSKFCILHSRLSASWRVHVTLDLEILDLVCHKRCHQGHGAPVQPQCCTWLLRCSGILFQRKRALVLQRSRKARWYPRL